MLKASQGHLRDKDRLESELSTSQGQFQGIHGPNPGVLAGDSWRRQEQSHRKQPITSHQLQCSGGLPLSNHTGAMIP